MINKASSILPYTPQPFVHGRLWGFSHPQLRMFFQGLLPLEQPHRDARARLYREHPNLVQEVILPADLHLPWTRLVVKRFGWRGVQHYWLSPLKRSKAMKAYRVACHLLAHGLPTPLPLGVFEERRWGFIRYNVYATEALTDVVTLRKYCASLPEGVAGLHEVMQLVASYTRRLHDSGLWHRDMVVSNFLLSGPPGQRQVYLVDLNRAWRLPYVPGFLRAIDLARITWREWQPQFCALYCSKRFSTRRLLWIMRLYGRWRACRWYVRRWLKARRTVGPAARRTRHNTHGETP
jgi:hypothetical protein